MSEFSGQLHRPDSPVWRSSRSRADAEPAPAGTRASRAVSVGRRLTSVPWPRQLEALRAAPKRLAWTFLEARLVDSPFRYGFRELVKPDLADYALRHSAGRISLRHRSGDIDIFRKFYAYDYYRWPDAVMRELRQLNRPVNVLDLGANIGFFEVHAREQLPIGEVVGFEPDPANANVLARVRAANGANWEVIRACASNAQGTVMFNTGRKNFSRIDGEGDCPIRAVDVFPYIARADLVKMNIEGSEWEILQDPRFADVSPVWIVEYHRIRNPEPDIHALAARLFEREGYTTRLSAKTNGNGLLWAWKPNARRSRPRHSQPTQLAAE